METAHLSCEWCKGKPLSKLTHLGSVPTCGYVALSLRVVVLVARARVVMKALEVVEVDHRVNRRRKDV